MGAEQLVLAGQKIMPARIVGRERGAFDLQTDELAAGVAALVEVVGVDEPGQVVVGAVADGGEERGVGGVHDGLYRRGGSRERPVSSSARRHGALTRPRSPYGFNHFTNHSSAAARCSAVTLWPTPSATMIFNLSPAFAVLYAASALAIAIRAPSIGQLGSWSPLTISSGRPANRRIMLGQ